jgi:hypothetical protein
MTFSIMAFSIMTFSIITFSIMVDRFVVSVINAGHKPFLLSVIIQNVIMLSVLVPISCNVQFRKTLV